MSYSALSQGLLERTQLGIPAHESALTTLVGDPIFNKSVSKRLDLFSISSEKAELPIDGIRINASSQKIKSLHKKQNIELAIPVNTDKEFIVKLYPYDIRSAGYSILAESKSDSPSSVISFYKGVIADDPNSAVQLTVAGDQISMLIMDSQGSYNLGPLPDGRGYILYDDAELGSLPFDCQSDGAIAELDVNIAKEENLRVEKSSDCLKIYAEIDYQSYVNFGRDISVAEQFVLSSFAQVAILYENLYSGSSYGIPIEISGLKVWDTPDPYSAESNVTSALYDIASTIDPHDYNADLVHLISAKSSGGYSGVAFVGCAGDLCKSSTVGTSNPYAVSQTLMSYQDVPVYSWTVNVLAHEMGHNLGSPHTQQCAWGPNENQAIDGCVGVVGDCANPGYPNTYGTIMSYCHFLGRPGISFDLAFGSEVGNHLYDEYQRSLSFGAILECVVDDEPPAIVLCPNPLSIDSNQTTDFENSNLIFWNNVDDDDTDWIRQTGSTPSFETGPTTAIDGSYYYYIEASGANHPNKTAIIQSECLDLSAFNAPVLSFQCHMYGEDMGSLLINVITQDSTYSILETSGDQGNSWIDASVDLSSFQNEAIQIQFVGTTGIGWKSDIAIDLLSIIDDSSSCSDGIQNGDETGIDCGGSFCEPCMQCDAEGLEVKGSMDITSDETRIIKDDIITSAPIIIDNNVNVTWQAGGTINLGASFEIRSGSTISLQTKGCVD